MNTLSPSFSVAEWMVWSANQLAGRALIKLIETNDPFRLVIHKEEFLGDQPYYDMYRMSDGNRILVRDSQVWQHNLFTDLARYVYGATFLLPGLEWSGGLNVGFEFPWHRRGNLDGQWIVYVAPHNLSEPYLREKVELPFFT